MIPSINLEDCDLAVQDFFANLGEKSSVVICKEGKPCYFFADNDDFQEEVLSLSQNQEFMNYLSQCRQRGRTEGTLSFAEVQERLANLDSAEQTSN